MKLNPAQRGLITQFAAKFPVPTTSEEDSRAWTRSLCEQLAYTFPMESWGHKSQYPDYPPSKDTIAQRNPFIGWDVITNSATPAARLSLDGENYDLAGQHFIRVVPTDYLGVEPPPPDDDLEARVTALEAKVRALDHAAAAVSEAWGKV
jgi:hypothetical protein